MTLEGIIIFFHLHLQSPARNRLLGVLEAGPRFFFFSKLIFRENQESGAFVAKNKRGFFY